ncbi:MAG: hypothetical protein K2X81_09585 [Candidatus Obscuribacterales bacterium]|nr:hypothetical protein [Candidatus Obscuribacterales bacterium]
MGLFLLKLVLTAIAFAFILPLIPGISFHGGVMMALLISLFFGVMLWVTDLVALALSTILAVGSMGIALLWLVPLWLLGFWMLPAVALRLLADFMPNNLSITGWMPAILGGLVMMLIGAITTNPARYRQST